MREVAAAGIAEQAERVERDATTLGGLVHHRQQHAVIADLPLVEILVAIAILVAMHADRKQGAQHDAPVPFGERGERVAVGDEKAQTAVHGDDELAAGHGSFDFGRDVQAVAEARIAAQCIDHARAAAEPREGARLIARAGSGWANGVGSRCVGIHGMRHRDPLGHRAGANRSGSASLSR